MVRRATMWENRRMTCLCVTCANASLFFSARLKLPHISHFHLSKDRTFVCLGRAVGMKSISPLKPFSSHWIREKYILFCQYQHQIKHSGNISASPSEYVCIPAKYSLRIRVFNAEMPSRTRLGEKRHLREQLSRQKTTTGSNCFRLQYLQYQQHNLLKRYGFFFPSADPHPASIRAKQRGDKGSEQSRRESSSNNNNNKSSWQYKLLYNQAQK